MLLCLTFLKAPENSGLAINSDAYIMYTFAMPASCHDVWTALWWSCCSSYWSWWWLVVNVIPDVMFSGIQGWTCSVGSKLIHGPSCRRNIPAHDATVPRDCNQLVWCLIKWYLWLALMSVLVASTCLWYLGDEQFPLPTKFCLMFCNEVMDI